MWDDKYDDGDEDDDDEDMNDNDNDPQKKGEDEEKVHEKVTVLQWRFLEKLGHRTSVES